MWGPLRTVLVYRFGPPNYCLAAFRCLAGPLGDNPYNSYQETTEDPEVEGSRSYQSSVTPLFTEGYESSQNTCFAVFGSGKGAEILRKFADISRKLQKNLQISLPERTP